MLRKVLYVLFGLLVVESLLIVLAFQSTTGGAVASVGTPLSQASGILIGAFIITLISILASLYLVRSSGDEGLADETKISREYLEERLEGKSKKRIIKDLLADGYSQEEIDDFLKEWERREEKT